MRRSGNIFEGMQSQDMASGLLQALQDAGTIRQEVNIPAVTYIMDNLANSMVNSSKTGSAPPYDELLETIAEMLDRMLTPEGGGDIEAGKTFCGNSRKEPKDSLIS